MENDPTQKVTSEDLAWNTNFYGGIVKRNIPEQVTTLTLDDQVMSVFETSKTYVQFPYQAFGTSCTQEDLMEVTNR